MKADSTPYSMPKNQVLREEALEDCGIRRRWKNPLVWVPEVCYYGRTQKLTIPGGQRWYRGKLASEWPDSDGDFYILVDASDNEAEPDETAIGPGRALMYVYARAESLLPRTAGELPPHRRLVSDE